MRMSLAILGPTAPGALLGRRPAWAATIAASPRKATPGTFRRAARGGNRLPHLFLRSRAAASKDVPVCAERAQCPGASFETRLRRFLRMRGWDAPSALLKMGGGCVKMQVALNDRIGLFLDRPACEDAVATRRLFHMSDRLQCALSAID